MKKSSGLLFLLLFCLLGARPAPAQISRITPIGVGNGGNASVSSVSTTSFTTGNFLWCAVAFNSMATPQLADTLGSSFQFINSENKGTTGAVSQFYAFTSSGAQDTVTASISPSSATYPAIVCRPYSGVASNNPLASDMATTAAGASGISSAGVTLAAGQLAVAAGTSDAAEIFTPGASFGNEQNASIILGTEDSLPTAAASYPAAMNGNNGANWAIVTAVFNASGAAPAPAHEIILTWTAPSGVTVSSYNIYRDGSKIGSATATTYTDTSITPGTTYTYTVTSIVNGVESTQAPITAFMVPTP